MKLSPFFVAVTLSSCTILGAQQANPSTDGLELLQKVAQRYSDAKTYSIESVEEITNVTDLSRHWSRQVMTAAEGTGGRFYFEGRTENGDAVRISDGKTVWTYHAEQHRFTVSQAFGDASARPTSIGISEMGMFQAENLRSRLAHAAEQFKSAQRLADADLTLDGRTISCEVVRIGRADLKRPRGDGAYEETIWIDKNTSTIVKVVENTTWTFVGISHQQETATIYSRTALDAPPDESLFVFVPPADAHQVKDFPPPREQSLGATLIGDRMPPLKLKAADGTVIPIESFRGKTVLIDLWATWCAPCVAALPAMAKLAQEGKDKGLVLIAIDRDEDADKASEYLNKKGLMLTNFHDGEGQVESLLGNSPMPRDLIVDPEGWVVADGQWVTPDGQVDENRLRTQLAGIAPGLKDLAPKPPPSAPCIAAK